MTKAELIKRHGLEWYEQYKARHNTQCKARKKELYQNDPEYRESIKARNRARYQNNSEFRKSCNERHRAHNRARYQNDPEYRKRLCEQTRVRIQASYVEYSRIDLIENYELALADNFKDWDIHHRLEIHEDYINSTKHMKLMNLYYNRPPAELIWLRHSEHSRIHNTKNKVN